MHKFKEGDEVVIKGFVGVYVIKRPFNRFYYKNVYGHTETCDLIEPVGADITEVEPCYYAAGMDGNIRTYSQDNMSLARTLKSFVDELRRLLESGNSGDETLLALIKDYGPSATGIYSRSQCFGCRLARGHVGSCEPASENVTGVGV